MADLHVTTQLIAAAPRSGASAAPGTPAAAADAALLFSRLFAGELEGGAPQAAPREGEPRESKEQEPAAKHGESEAADPLQLLGLPVALPQPAVAAEPPPVKSKAAEAPATIVPLASKDGQKLDTKAASVPADIPAARPEAIAPAEPRKEAAALRAGDDFRVLAQMHESHTTQGPAGARPALPVAAPVGTPQWREEFSAAVRVIATEKIQSAELHLHPPELGPVQVSLHMDDNRASLAFTAPHADTRQALEAALPRLRELLEAGGISLGSTSVDVSGSGASGREAGDPGARGPAAALPVDGTAVPEAPVPVRSLRLLDVFA